MTHSSPPEQQFLERFLTEHPEGSFPEFEAWAKEQREFVVDSGIEKRARTLLERHLQVRKLFPQGSSVDRPALSVFHRRPSASEDSQVMPGTEGLRSGQRIGHFRLTRFIARGGMGQVWEAEDENLRNKVALKLVLPGRIDTRNLELFAREARAGGRLNHPNIVRTLAHGTDEGLAWIAQELVEESWTLKDFLDDLRTEQSVPKDYYPHLADFVAQLADALQAAHSAGVIHRDVKPQNILITPDDRPKLTDFGLARVTEDSFHSQSGDFAGTFAYMSPEQVTAKRMGLDHRTDIFSLGIVLYELLALRRPFEGDTTHQIATQIITHDPVDPSKVRSQCPGELAIIATKALEKDPDRRYGTMSDFAADLRRHLANEPIQAKPPGKATRALKWMQRHPTTTSVISVVSVALILVSLALTAYVRTSEELAMSVDDQKAKTVLAERQTALANDRAGELEERDLNRRLLAISQELGKGNYARANRWMEAIPESRRDGFPWRLLHSQLDSSLKSMDALDAHFSPEGERLLTVSLGDSVVIRAWPSGKALRTLQRPGTKIRSAIFSPSGNLVATWAYKEPTVTLWDAYTGEWVRNLDGHTDYIVSVGFSPDSGQIVTATTEGAIRVWDVLTGSPEGAIGENSIITSVREVAFGPSGDRLIVLAGDHTSSIFIFDSVTRELLGKQKDWGGYVMSHDGSWIYSGNERLDIANGKLTTFEGFRGNSYCPVLSADGKFLATFGFDKEKNKAIRILDTETGRSICTIALDSTSVNELGFSPDATRVIAALTDGTACIWDAVTGDLDAVLVGHTDEVTSARFSLDGMTVMTCSTDFTARIWNVEFTADMSGVFPGDSQDVGRPYFSPDGDLLTGESDSTRVSAWDLDLAERFATVEYGLDSYEPTFGIDGRLLIKGGNGKSSRQWDLRTGELRILKIPGAPKGVVSHFRSWFGSTGNFLVTHEVGHSPQLWQMEPCRPVELLAEGLAKDRSLALALFGPKDTRLCTQSWGSSAHPTGDILLWDVATGRLIGELGGHEFGSKDPRIDYSPNGFWIATSGMNSIKIWAAASGQQVHTISHQRGYPTPHFSPDSQLLLYWGQSAPHLFDMASGSLIGSLDGHSENAWGEFSPDGQYILTCSSDSTARLWSVDSLECLLVLGGPEYRVDSAQFSPDGTRIVTTSDAGLRIWNSKPFRERLPALQRNRGAREAMKPLIQDRLAKGETLAELRLSIATDNRLGKAEQHAGLVLLTMCQDIIRETVRELFEPVRPLAEVLETVRKLKELNEDPLGAALHHANQLGPKRLDRASEQ